MIEEFDVAARWFVTASAATTHQDAQAAFTRGWNIARPRLERVLRSILRSSELEEEALSRTSLKLWIHLRGTETRPKRDVVIEGGVVKTAAKTAAYDLLKKLRTQRKNELYEDSAWNGGSILSTDDTIDDLRIEFATHTDDADIEQREGRRAVLHLADIAAAEYHKPMWAAVLRQFAAGHTRWVEIANELGIPAATVRSAVHEMRRSPIRHHLTDAGPAIRTLALFRALDHAA